MTNEKKEQTVEEVLEAKKDDTTWKKKPWVSTKDGFEYRRQRVQLENGDFKVIDVRIGTEPLVPPKEGK